MRQSGWEVWRIDEEMTLHDAAMTRPGQWWKRCRRAGHAFAERAFLHGALPERHWVRETWRAVLWGLVLPLVVLAGLLVTPWASPLLVIYPVMVLRLYRRYGWERALFITLSRFLEAVGAVQYHFNRLRRRRAALIEYE